MMNMNNKMVMSIEEYKKAGFVNLKGKWYATLSVLLNSAHKKFKGNFSIKTKMIEFNREDRFALFVAQVTVGEEKQQIFTGYGDSSKDNTSAMVQTAYLRMAETRAVCRALRFATNIAETSKEEL